MLILCAPEWAAAREPAMTVLTDFEDPSVAVSISAVRNVLLGDCRAWLNTLPPTRERGSLAIEIGATRPDVSVVCDLTFRTATRFPSATSVSTYCWSNAGVVQVAFRVRDADGQVFETAPRPVELLHRWVLLTAELAPAQLRRVSGRDPLAWPLEIQGYRITTNVLGKQTVWLDDLQVEHEVTPRELIRGEFGFDVPTRVYEPGSAVRATVTFENKSRTYQLDLAVELTWLRPDGTPWQTQRGRVSLPRRIESRSYRTIDFSQTLREPGLYRLVAQARAPGWPAPSVFETTIAITPSNRGLPRGRSTFFAVRSNLIREPDLDQQLEINIARDCGVNLLALDVPWARLEPKADAYDFAALAQPVDLLVAKDIVPLVVITGRPEWLPAGQAAARVQRLIAALAEHFGPRLQRFLVAADALDTAEVADHLRSIGDLQARLAERFPKIVVYPPPVDVRALETATAVGTVVHEQPTLPVVFHFSGDSDRAHAALLEFRARGDFAWQPAHWWSHLAAPAVGPGTGRDAEAVLRLYVHAAAAGVSGLMWSDLRDDDNNPEQPELLRGLVRRDFSPRATLVGYAAAAGRLTGFSYAGPVANTPPEFDSAHFLGGEQQIAILLPRPNRVLPAALALTQELPGDLTVQDFERRPHPLLISSAAPLVPTTPQPLFITLTLKQPSPEPKFGLTTPWLRAPRTVFCAPGAEFAIVVEPPAAPVAGGYLALLMPRDAPLTATFSATALPPDLREPLVQPVRIEAKQPAASWELQPLTLRAKLGADVLDLPLEARPLTDVQRLSRRRGILDGRYQIADVGIAGGSARLTLHGAYAPDALHLAVIIHDNRFTPYAELIGAPPAGDYLLLGAARAGEAGHTEARLDPPRTQFTAIESPTVTDLAWRCTRGESTGADTVTYLLEIPTADLGGPDLREGDSLLLSVCYHDDDGDGTAGTELRWGGGFDGSGTTANYRWLRLIQGAP